MVNDKNNFMSSADLFSQGGQPNESTYDNKTGSSLDFGSTVTESSSEDSSLDFGSSDIDSTVTD